MKTGVDKGRATRSVVPNPDSDCHETGVGGTELWSLLTSTSSYERRLLLRAASPKEY